MIIENNFIYGATKEDVINMLISLDDGASFAKYGNKDMALYELESLYMRLTGTNVFN
jgi:hypothetical protein